jgi:hypothetical protein
VERDSLVISTGEHVAVVDTIAAPGDLDLRMDPDSTMRGVFPLAYINLAGGGEGMEIEDPVTVPAFPRRSRLIDYVLGLGSQQDLLHPDGSEALTEDEKEMFNLWVLLGAQYR